MEVDLEFRFIFWLPDSDTSLPLSIVSYFWRFKLVLDLVSSLKIEQNIFNQ